MKTPREQIEEQIRARRDAGAALQSKLALFLGPDWRQIGESLASDLPRLRSQVRDYSGSDWRELGHRQGELTCLERILAIPDRIRAEVQRLGEEIDKLTTRLEGL